MYPFAGGGGTQAAPYQISTITHLNAIRDNSGLSGENYLDDHFVLLNDLDFTGHRYSADDEENAKGWLPIGHDINKDVDGFQGTEFTGSFDGGGYVIRNLSISRGGEDYIGLFGYIGSPFTSETGSLTNLGLEGVAVEGNKLVGGLVGAIPRCWAVSILLYNRAGGGQGAGRGLLGICCSDIHHLVLLGSERNCQREIRRRIRGP